MITDLGIQQNGEPVLFSQLYPRLDLFCEVDHQSFDGNVLEVPVEGDLRLDDGAEAVVRAEERQQAGELLDVFLNPPIGGAKNKVFA